MVIQTGKDAFGTINSDLPKKYDILIKKEMI